MLFIAIINGAMRDGWYGKHMSELRAHQVSTLVGSVLMGIFIWFLSRTWKLESVEQAMSIGSIWFCLTVAFEFLFGHFVGHHAWSRLLQDYNLLKGRVWVLFLVWITVAPYVFFRLNQ